MPNRDNVIRPIVFIGLGRSGTSAITEMLGEYPDIDNVGEVSPVLWDMFEDVKSAYINMRYPTSLTGELTRDGFPAMVVRSFFCDYFHSSRPLWVIKPIGLLGKARERFVNRSSDESFIDWYFRVVDACFPEAQIYCLVRDPIEYAHSARRYWRASVSDIRDDIRFIGALLRSGRLPADHFLSFAEFTREQESFLERVMYAAGSTDVKYRGEYKNKRFAATQGRALQDAAAISNDGLLSNIELASLWSAIGEEFSPYLISERPALDSVDLPDEDAGRDYKTEYRALCDEYEFMKTKAEGLENLANSKEDIIQDLVKWSKMLDDKAERFAKALLESGIPIPPPQ